MSALNKILSDIDPDKTRIHVDDPLAVAKISWDLARRLKSKVDKDMDLILLCIGTYRSTGDCLGPLVGTKVSSWPQDFFWVYGTLDQPVHASNLKEKLDEVYRMHQNPFIVAVDACLGQMDNVGMVSLANGSLQPGAGVNKSLPPVGHIHITGTVNVGGFLEYLVLQNTRLNLVMRLAETISSGLIKMILDYPELSA